MKVHNARSVAAGRATASLIPAQAGETLAMHWNAASGTYTPIVMRGTRKVCAVGQVYRLQVQHAARGVCRARLVSVVQIKPVHMSMRDIQQCGFAHYGELTDKFTYRQPCWLLRWDDIKEIT